MGRLEDMKRAAAQGTGRRPTAPPRKSGIFPGAKPPPKPPAPPPAPPPPQPTEPAKGKKAKKKKERLPRPPPRVPPHMLRWKCGHETLKRDVKDTPCPLCRSAKRQLRNQKRNSRRRENHDLGAIVRGRLPGGAKFTADYDADTQMWVGQLSLTEFGEAVVFGPLQASGVMKLLPRLDDQYREWHRKRAKAAARAAQLQIEGPPCPTTPPTPAADPSATSEGFSATNPPGSSSSPP